MGEEGPTQWKWKITWLESLFETTDFLFRETSWHRSQKETYELLGTRRRGHSPCRPLRRWLTRNSFFQVVKLSSRTGWIEWQWRHLYQPRSMLLRHPLRTSYRLRPPLDKRSGRPPAGNGCRETRRGPDQRQTWRLQYQATVTMLSSSAPPVDLCKRVKRKILVDITISIDF